MRVLFATAELAPYVKVGGLADASAGLVHALREAGVHVDLILPDYGNLPFDPKSARRLDVPDWAGPATARRGLLNSDSAVLIVAPGLARAHPYLDPDGRGWSDNDQRFFAFSAAIAALVAAEQPDLLHLNDWHTAATLGFLDQPPPSALTVHNLAYQGTTAAEWLERIPHPEAYAWNDRTNPLAGGIALADRVVTVSPTFAEEVQRPKTGFGLHELLGAKGDAFVGILNGIETGIWNPATDPHLPVRYERESVSAKQQIKAELFAELGWDPSDEPLIGMVTRLADQKGVDIALDAASALPQVEARMILLGSGERALVDAARDLATRMPERFVFRSGYNEELSHRIFGASDLYMMPSRFEPGGLTQMQAMRYGTIPIVTDVGGLHDTVIDADAHPDTGNGFVALEPTSTSVGDALGRAVRAWRSSTRRSELIGRGMSRDWSWTGPAREYLALYEEIISAR